MSNLSSGQKLYIGALLVCLIGMGLMMWMMSKSMGGQQEPTMPDARMTIESSEERLDALRAQRQTLAAEITEVTRLAELEARREALRTEKVQALS